MEDSLDQFANQIAQGQNPGNALYNLGVDNYGWSPAFADYKQILEQLKTDDQMLIYEAMINLSNQLSMAQENTLATFPLDQYIPTLVDILKRPPQTDLANEVNMFVIQCLTNLMDIFPNICGTIVNHGAVKSITEVLERSMGFIDLNDACIKCMEKISLENPYAILTSGAIGLCLNMMDFFEIPTQKKILILTLNVSRHSASEQDLNDHILPILPCLCNLLQSRGDSASSKIETVIHIAQRICESVMRFYSPLSHFEKVTEQFEKIGDTGIIDSILQKLQDYCVTDESMEMDTVNQIQQSVSKPLTNLSIQYTMKVLAQCSRYSHRLTQMIIDYDIFRLLSTFLPSREDLQKIQLSSDKFPFIIETIQLIDTLLPEREDQLKGDHDKQKLELEKKKRNMYMGQYQPMVYFMAEKMLPKVFFVYDNNMSINIRNKTLQVIDKTISLFNDELLNNFIEPYSFAKFIYSNLRTNHLPSMQLCLQMVNKLMKSNPKTYTLPLMREGVTAYIKKISTQESLEKTLNIKLDEQPQPTEPTEKSEEFLAKARLAILQKGDVQDKEGQQQLEATIQKYLEASRLHSQSSQQNPNKNLIEHGKKVLELAGPLSSEFFDNEEFQAKLNEWYGEEFKIINMLKNLAKDIVEEAKQEAFNFDRTKALMKQLSDCLTSKRQIMNFEFRESGLLEALELILTHTPKQVQVNCEQEKQGEEVKHSEEMQMSQMIRKSQQISKKEARSYIQRLKVFTHIILSKVNDKKPIQELINLCHEQLSQSEHEIFNLQPSNPEQVLGNQFGNLFAQNLEDPNSSVVALRQLTKRVRVNLVYDPSKKFLNQNQQTLASMSNKDVEGLLQPPPLIQHKAQSHHPAFLVLGGERNKEDEPHSKVYMKRNFLYNELQQVLISVEQCASLYILEDFLRNKIRTVEDVKALKTPHSFYSGLKRGSSQLQSNVFVRNLLDRALDRMREILENGNSRDQMRHEGDEFAEQFAQEIIDAKDLTDGDQAEIIKQLETQTLQLMDDFYAEQEGSHYEDIMRDELENDGDDLNTEQKIVELQRIIETLRHSFRTKLADKKEAELLKEAVKKQETQSLAPATDTEMKVEGQQLNLEEQLQKLKQPELQQQPPVQEEEKKDNDPAKREDVEMTDEEDEEHKKIMEVLEKKKAMMQQKMQSREIELSVQDNQNSIKDMDLDELIKAVGDDIEFEFYYNGQMLTQNQTIFEILRQAEQKSKAVDPLVAAYKTEASSNIYFLIKDKRDELTIQRKDSLLEFAAKRERTKSEAVEDISVSAVNSLVQQLIDKEFQVFSKDLTNPQKSKDKQSAELNQLESALKILKVLNFICKNIHLFSNQGMMFLINTYNDEEQKDEVFSDIALQIGVSELQGKIFHHHKLDSFILKNIQDPYTLIGGGISETLQQIFRNCPFLFPFQTRQLFFKLISFIGSIDMNRSIYFLRQFLKNKLGKLPPEDKNTAVKFSKQKVIVDRNRILDSAYSLMKQINKRAFLEVQYKDEAGTGLGPTLEFYYLVSNEIKNAEITAGKNRVSIWRKGMIDNSLFPSPISIPQLRTDELQKFYEIFRLTGMMIAKSISDDRLIDLPISPLLWDLVLGKKMNIFDLERIDKDLFKIFAELQIIANKKKELDKQVYLDQESKNRQMNTLRTQQGARIEDLSLTFTLPGYDNIELKQNGKAIDVTLNNLQEYIDLVMHYTFHESIKIQISAFKKGFNAIFPVDTLKPFSTTNELEDMICGVQKNDEEWTNVLKLMENVVPLHGYHSKSTEYLDLLRFMGELDHEERRKFLKFVTGSPRLPNGGFASLEPRLTVVHKKPINASENPDDILPSVMTCQNYIKLPSYSSYEKLKVKFQMAYNEGTNNFTLS